MLSFCLAFRTLVKIMGVKRKLLPDSHTLSQVQQSLHMHDCVVYKLKKRRRASFYLVFIEDVWTNLSCNPWNGKRDKNCTTAKEIKSKSTFLRSSLLVNRAAPVLVSLAFETRKCAGTVFAAFGGSGTGSNMWFNYCIHYPNGECYTRK